MRISLTQVLAEGKGGTFRNLPMEFDVANLVGDLVATESVPCLPVFLYKPAGLENRTARERTWELQRLEDAVDALFEELSTKTRRREE